MTGDSEVNVPLASRQALTVFLCLLLACLPVWGGTPELVGVAKARGRARINGMLLPGESNVFNGDRVGTDQRSTLTISLGPRETIRFAPGSTARLDKDGAVTVISLKSGALRLRTVGHTRVALETYGVTIATRGGFPAVAQVALMSDGEARVWALKGTIEVAGGAQSVLLQPGQSAVIAAATPEVAPEEESRAMLSTKPQSQAEAETGAVTGRVLTPNRVVIRGAQVLLISATGVTYTTVSDAVGSFTFERVAPGRYTLRVSAPGFGKYEEQDLVVNPGQETAHADIMLQGGGAGGNTALIITLVVAGVGAGVGFGLAGGGKDGAPVPPVSPSSP